MSFGDVNACPKQREHICLVMFAIVYACKARVIYCLTCLGSDDLCALRVVSLEPTARRPTTTKDTFRESHIFDQSRKLALVT